MNTRMPYGMAKQIVGTLRVGDACMVRPCWMISFHNAARALGMRLASVGVTVKGEKMFRMVRVDGMALTGQQARKLPRRDRVSGRWWRKVAA